MTQYSECWLFRDEISHLDIDIILHLLHAMTALNEASFFIHLNNPYFALPLNEKMSHFPIDNQKGN